MLEISSIRWRNFLSYGDYETELTELDKQGPVLITGQVVDPDGVVASNGAGKSTITVAIIWCLFGRTFNKDRPGDNIVNYFIGKDCYVEIETTDGWIIRRTRKMSGHDDLTVYVHGKDETRSTNTAAQEFINKKFNLNYNIFATSTFFGQMSKAILEMSDPVRKETLERLLGLELLNQWALAAKGKLKGVEAKQELKRAILDRVKSAVITYRDLVKSNQQECADFEGIQQDKIIELEVEADDKIRGLKDWESNRLKIDKYERTLLKLVTITQSRTKLAALLSDKRAEVSEIGIKIGALRNQIDRYETWRAEYNALDFPAIRAAHHEVKESEAAVTVASETITKLTLEKRGIDQDANRLAIDINEWKEKEGSTCPHCKQQIADGHITDCVGGLYQEVKTKLAESKQIAGKLSHWEHVLSECAVERPDIPLSEVDRIEKKLVEIEDSLSIDAADLSAHFDDETILNSEIEDLVVKITKIDDVLAFTKVPMTLVDIESSRRQHQDRVKELDRLEAEIKSKKLEKNPYDKVVIEMKASLKKVVDELKTLSTDLKDLNLRARHYQYLWRSYTDRNKIKKLLLTTMIPYLNQRIQYYLDCFRCPIKISFRTNLAVESSVWNYDYCSGGERRRIDLSIMFALHDLYLGIHGRQCNIMVLDEVDGRLDGAGIESFIDVVNNDFTKSEDGRSKPGTVFVISHRSEMVDAFPTKIVVKKDANSYSHLVI